MRNRTAGFSLIELMIAMGLGVGLLFGVMQIFDANKRSNTLQNAYSETQESGRIAVEFISRDIRMADFWGCAPDTDAIVDHLDATDPDYATVAGDLTGKKAVEGENDVAGSPVIGGITVKNGTDTLTLRGSYAMSGVKIIAPYMNVNAATVHLNLAAGADIPKGTVVLVSDCSGADRITNTANNTAGGGNLIHNTGNAGAGNVDNAIKNLSHTYTGGAQISIPFKRVYFIGQNPDGGWSLYREDKGVSSELVRNIDDLQLTYGEDTNADGSADIYRTADLVVEMNDVISIRASFDAQSNGNVPNPAGGVAPLERTYATTVNIRNRSLK